jgi:DNA polymerase-3 subunit delta'
MIWFRRPYVWQIIGQSNIVSLLQGALEKGALAHAYLFIGPTHVGKMTLALELAKALNCDAEDRPCGGCVPCQKIAAGGHADVQVIGLTQNDDSAEAKLIGIDQVKDMQHSASLPPFEGKYKVFIIDGAEFLSSEAANCLLKTLEEPVGSVIFILLTANDGLLPATVISRCQRLEMRPLAAAEVEAVLAERGNIAPERNRLLARLCHGCPGWALAAATDDSLLKRREEEMNRLNGIVAADYEERFAFVAQLTAQFTQNRTRVHELLDIWLDYWRDLLLVKAGCPDIVTNIDYMDRLNEMAQEYTLAQVRAFIASIEAAGKQLRQNANPRLALEVLMLDVPERSKAARKTS